MQIVEVMVPILIIMMVIVPLKEAVHAILGIAFSFTVHTLSFVLFIIEKLTHTLDWAGKKYAWIFVLIMPLTITMPIGGRLYGDVGAFGGAAVGFLVGSGVIFEHTEDEDHLGGFSKLFVLGVGGVLAAIMIGGGALVYFL